MALGLASAVEEIREVHVLMFSDLGPPIVEGVNGELCLDD